MPLSAGFSVKGTLYGNKTTGELAQQKWPGLITAAAQGLGIARAASFYAERALADGEVVEILSDWTREKTPVWIVYPSGRNIPRRVSCAVNDLLDHFREEVPWD